MQLFLGLATKMIRKFLLVFCLFKFATAIVSRQVALDGQFPYVGLIEVGNKRANAVLISNKTLLTAILPEYFDPKVEVKLSLGSRFASKADPQRQVFELTAENIIIHPENSRETITDNVVLLRVPSIKLSNTVQPVPLPGWSDKGRNYHHDPLFVVSYGRDSLKRPFPKVVRYFNSSVSPFHTCQKLRKVDYRTDFCLTTAVGIPLCDGDIGAPIFATTDDGVPELIGLGVSVDCDLRKPSVATKVTTFLKWINDQTSAEIDN